MVLCSNKRLTDADYIWKVNTEKMDPKRSFQGYSIDSLRLKKCGSFDVHDSGKVNRVSAFRRLLSQFLATCSINLILFDIGLAISYPTLVVSALLHVKENSSLPTSNHSFDDVANRASNVSRDHFATNSSRSTDAGYEPLADPYHESAFFTPYTLQAYQATWYVSIMYISQPIGSIIGGSIIGNIGRKRLMQILNVFMLAGWLLPFFSTGPAYMYLSNVVMGIGIGCSEAPIATYLGEVTQVSIRGIILNLSQAFLSVSFLIPYLVSIIVTSWRWQALILSSVPLLTFIVCCLTPETPAWLISKRRYKDAEKSLMWLRGWTTPEDIKEELDDMTNHISSTGTDARSQTAAQSHKSTEELVKSDEDLKERILYYFKARMRRPFIIVCVMFALLYITGMGAIRPYLVLIIEEMDIKMDAGKCALWVTFAGVIGTIVSLCIIKITGKRFITLSALAGSAACTAVISLIKMGFISTAFSFASLLAMSFCSGYGIVSMPWMMQSELYPFRGRGMISGVGAAFSYVVGFVSTKSYIGLTRIIETQGVFLLFTGFSVCGFVYLWFKLPETEGRTFEEIDEHFNSLDKKERE